MLGRHRSRSPFVPVLSLVSLLAFLSGCGAASPAPTSVPTSTPSAPAATAPSAAGVPTPSVAPSPSIAGLPATPSAGASPTPGATLAAATATTTGAVAPTTPTTVPAAPGTPSPPPATAAVRTAASSSADWATYHGNNLRTGVAGGPASFTSVAVAWRSAPLDGETYAEPLVVGGRALVATENNTLYSFDLASGKEAWHTHIGEPMSGAALPCGDIATSGITGTPVVDVGRGLVYAVAFVQPGRHQLVALDLASGAVRFRASADPPGSDPLAHQQRAALALAGSQVYVAFGGLFGDCSDYHGWVLALDAATGATRASYQVPTQREGGIWAPPGPSIDGTGDVYVATGNGSSESPSRFDDGDAVLKLSPDLRLLDWFAPVNWAQLNADDADIGSTSPALLDGNLVFQIGKAGVGYLLHADQLGHLGGQIYQAQVCSGAFGGTAYQAPMLYVPCTDGLVALRVAGNSFTTAWRVPGFFAGPPIVAAGAVWTIGRDGTLYALGPADGNVRQRVPVGTVDHFATPAASGPYLLVPASRQLIVEKVS